jgi:hypothetical protein
MGASSGARKGVPPRIADDSPSLAKAAVRGRHSVRFSAKQAPQFGSVQ